VREPREFLRGHIPDARSLPLPLVLTHQESLAKEGRIVLVCRSGRRSRRAACALISEGHTNIAILDGGMLGWESSGLLEAIDTFP
jgi:SulP family sulfate permease